MKLVLCAKRRLAILVILVSLVIFNEKAEAVTETSNLNDVWPIAGTIGDIHALFPGGAYTGTDTAHFSTGQGNYLLNSITLEFEDDSSYPAGVAAPQWISVQLFQKVGNAEVLLGSLGNAVADPTPTQWPQSSNPRAYTTFFDFSPSGQIDLAGFSQYSLVIGMPADSPVDAALMFTTSGYTARDGWGMGWTSSGETSTEYLKLAVNATRVPDRGDTAMLLGGGIIFLVLCGFTRRAFKTRR